MASNQCPQCGSFSNPPGAAKCFVCGCDLGGGPPPPVVQAAVRTPPAPTLAPVSPPAAAVRPPVSTSAPMLSDGSGRRYFLASGSPTLIGSKGCAVLLPGAGIEEKHARIVPAPSGFAIEPLAGMVSVNNAAITTHTPLSPGDTISIGGVTLTFSGPASPLVAPPLTVPPVVVTPPVTMPPVIVTPPVVVPSTAKVKGAPVLEGHVNVVNGPFQETPDRDWAGFLLRLGLMIVLSPLIILILFKQPTLVMYFLLWGSRSGSNQIPTRHLRVADAKGVQYDVRMKGESVSGTLMMGDDAQFWGRWKSGMLDMDRARNLGTSSDVVMKPYVRRQRNGAILGILLALLAFAVLSAYIGQVAAAVAITLVVALAVYRTR